jgi:hypothetical protein
LLAHGRYFSPGTPASSTTKTDHRDIAEILPKVALNTKNQNHLCLVFLWSETEILTINNLYCAVDEWQFLLPFPKENEGGG